MTTFFHNFLRLCARDNVKPTVVCQEIGIHKSNYSKWADGTTPGGVNLIKLAQYFDVSAEYFTTPIDEQAENAQLIKAYDKATQKERHIVNEILKEYFEK